MGCCFPRLDEVSVVSLEVPFSENEIFSALQGANGDKASGRDGFFFQFVKSYWQVFKDDMLALFQSFHCSREFDLRFS